METGAMSCAPTAVDPVGAQFIAPTFIAPAFIAPASAGGASAGVPSSSLIRRGGRVAASRSRNVVIRSRAEAYAATIASIRSPAYEPGQ